MSAAISSVAAPRAAALARRETERTDFEVPGAKQFKSIVSTLGSPLHSCSLQVPEAVLARDLIYACQGIDSKYLSYNGSASQQSEGFEVDAHAGVPTADRQVLLVLSEIGWLFK